VLSTRQSRLGRWFVVASGSRGAGARNQHLRWNHSVPHEHPDGCRTAASLRRKSRRRLRAAPAASSPS
jgi:hypothetical protein